MVKSILQLKQKQQQQSHYKVWRSKKNVYKKKVFSVDYLLWSAPVLGRGRQWATLFCGNCLFQFCETRHRRGQTTQQNPQPDSATTGTAEYHISSSSSSNIPFPVSFFRGLIFQVEPNFRAHVCLNFSESTQKLISVQTNSDLSLTVLKYLFDCCFKQSQQLTSQLFSCAQIYCSCLFSV